MKKWILPIVFLLLGIIFTSGCTNPQVSAPVSPVTAPPTSPSLAIPGTTSPPGVSLPSVTLKSDDFSQNTGTVTEPTTRIQVDNPYLEYLQVRKKTFDYNIPNCPMQSAFPAIVNDPDYGIQHQTPKLTALTEDLYEEFLRKYTEGKAENTRIKDIQGCQGAEGKPEWNFVEIRVILDPTNIRPTNYTISQNVRSNGKIIAQFMTTRTLVINEKVTLTSYVPVKSDELDLFDTVSVTYTRL